MSRLQVGGLDLVLNSLYPDMIGRTCVLLENKGLYTSPKTGVTIDSWVINIDNNLFIIRHDWLMPLGDKQTQDELLRESELENL